jgi:hypothetical protein
MCLLRFNPGRTETYSKAARDLGVALVEQNIKLIYGGASVGIMGVLADAVLEHGGQAVGVIPEALVKVETDPDVLLDRFSCYIAPDVKKWIEQTET